MITTLLAVCSKAGYNVKYLNDGMAAAKFVGKDDIAIQVVIKPPIVFILM